MSKNIVRPSDSLPPASDFTNLQSDFQNTNFLIEEKRRELAERRARRSGQVQIQTQQDVHRAIENTISSVELVEFQRNLAQRRGHFHEVSKNTHFVDRGTLVPGLSQLEIIYHATGEKHIITYNRESSAPYKKNREKPYLKFSDKEHEFIWNGIFDGKIKLYRRSRKGDDGYTPAPEISSIRIITVPG